MPDSLRPPAPRPCASCPYRRDVPSGVWAWEEYEKLRRYDRPTYEQPRWMFQCHQCERGHPGRRVCGGWAGCHGAELLAPRLALLDGHIDGVAFQAIVGYVSPVPLFASGNAAADHGQARVDDPGEDAEQLMVKIARVRSDLTPS
ncbi:DUF6283 family protein [Streptoverticillium reticulum]|uniref:DUF6283 family protein n=1 Tax=Streptoverticillium reticulum TaxID=1433415 RepID=UPI0039BF0FE9